MLVSIAHPPLFCAQCCCCQVEDAQKKAIAEYQKEHPDIGEDVFKFELPKATGQASGSNNLPPTHERIAPLDPGLFFQELNKRIEPLQQSIALRKRNERIQPLDPRFAPHEGLRNLDTHLPPDFSHPVPPRREEAFERIRRIPQGRVPPKPGIGTMLLNFRNPPPAAPPDGLIPRPQENRTSSGERIKR